MSDPARGTRCALCLPVSSSTSTGNRLSRSRSDRHRPRRSARADGVSEHIGDLHAPRRWNERAVEDDAQHHGTRRIGPLVGEEPSDGHGRVDDDAHPRRPSAMRSRIETPPSEWRLLSPMIWAAAASAWLRLRAGRQGGGSGYRRRVFQFPPVFRRSTQRREQFRRERGWQGCRPNFPR